MTKSSHAYDTIGDIASKSPTFGAIRAQVPRASGPPRVVLGKGDDNLELRIDALPRAVYQTLINVDKRPAWLDGVEGPIDRGKTSEQYAAHCVSGMKLPSIWRSSATCRRPAPATQKKSKSGRPAFARRELRDGSRMNR